MKNLIILFTTVFISSIINAQVISNFPWHDDFSTHGNGAGTTVNGWSCSPNNTSSFYWSSYFSGTTSSSTGPIDDNGGDHHYIYTEASGFSQGDIAYLTSPVFDLTGTSNAEISFYYHMYGSNMGDLIVEVLSGGVYHTEQTISGQQHVSAATAWTKSTIDISAYSGQISIRFKGVRGNGYKSDIAIDDFEITATVPCPGTSNELATNITSTSVKLNWNETGSAASWDIEYGITGFTQGNGATVNNILTQFTTINALTNSTDYEWYVRSDCGVDGNSVWKGPFAFTTHCNTIANTPWTENFDAMANIGYDVYPGCMSGKNFMTSSSSVPNMYSSSADKYISYFGNGGSDTLFSMPVNLTMNISYDFSVMYRKDRSTSASPINFKIGVARSKTGTPFTYLETVNSWEIDVNHKQCRATYTPTVTELVYFVLVINQDNSILSMCFDDLKIEATPTYLPPSEFSNNNITISSADLDWEEAGAEISWQIEYKHNSDFTPGTGNADAVSNINTNSETTISNLIHNSEYYWYVRSDNGGGNYSDWMGRGFFETEEGRILNPSPADEEDPVAISSRTINWDDVAGASSYRINIGTTPGASDIVNNGACANSEYTMPVDWQNNTRYYWTATIVYSGANTIIGEEYEFFTECTIINNFPYTTGFENGVPEDCWFQEDENGTTGEWSQASSMPNFYSYPPHTGSYMAAFNSNFASSGSSTRLYTPQLDLTGLASPEINFWMFYEATSSSANDRVQIQINTGAGWVNIGAAIARYHSGFGWQNHFIDMSAYANQIVRIAFLGISDQGKQMYIDDVSIQDAPACRKPYDLSVSYTSNYHTRDLIWTAATGTNAWQIEYGYEGFVQGAGTIINTSSVSPYHLAGLLAGADYEWYIRSDCGAGVYSDWVGPNAFSTKQYQSTTRQGITTKCSPTYDRLNADGTNGANAQYFYDKREFTVNTTGWYDMEITFDNRSGQIHIYQNSFDAQNPATNWLAADDGATSKSEHLFLTSGVIYIAIGVEETPISSGNFGDMTFSLYGAEVVTMPYYSVINGIALAVSHNVPTTDGNSRTANYQCTDVDDYTHYYDDNGTPTNYSDDNILLSAKLNSNNIGTLDNGGFEVRLAGTAGVSLIQPQAAPYVQDTSGWYVYNRYWNLTPIQQPTTPVNIRYYYQAADFSALQTAISNVGGIVPQLQTKTAYFKINSITGNYNPNPENGHNGVPLATSYNTDGCWIYDNGAAAGTNSWVSGSYGSAFYSEFQVGHFSGGGGGASPIEDNGSPLPISLSSFYAYKSGDANIIKWKTLSEENTQEFIIERSENNNDFEPIAKLNAAGNSNTLLEYSTLDNNPIAVAYYRLRTIDIDGKFSLSNTIIVKHSETNSFLQIKQIFPNPTSGKITLIFNSAIDSKTTIEITDMLGKTMLVKSIQSSEGGNEINLNLNDLSAGIYFIAISNRQDRVIKRIVVNDR